MFQILEIKVEVPP